MDWCGDGVTAIVLQHEFGLVKSTVWLWREIIGRGGVGAIGRRRKNSRYLRSLSFALYNSISAVRATAKPPLSNMTCATLRRYETGRSGAERVARTTSSSAHQDEGGGAFERRCASLEMEVEDLKRVAAAATALSAADESARR